MVKIVEVVLIGVGVQVALYGTSLAISGRKTGKFVAIEVFVDYSRQSEDWQS